MFRLCVQDPRRGGEVSSFDMPSKSSPNRLENPVPHIRYESPYGGHPILRKRGPDAYAAAVSFLRNCTDWNGIWPDNTIQRLPPDNYIKPDDRNDKIIAELANTLGRPRAGITFQSVSLGSEMTVASSSTADTWSAPAELHDWAVNRVLEAPPAQRGWPDPISCTCGLDFRLRDPDSGQVLAGQATEGSHYDLGRIRSGLLLSVSAGNTSAFFDLALPFEKPDADFVAYVAKLRPFLPIRLAKGNFKHYVPNKAQDGFVKRRVDASLLTDI